MGGPMPRYPVARGRVGERNGGPVEATPRSSQSRTGGMPLVHACQPMTNQKSGDATGPCVTVEFAVCVTVTVR